MKSWRKIDPYIFCFEIPHQTVSFGESLTWFWNTQGFSVAQDLQLYLFILPLRWQVTSSDIINLFAKLHAFWKTTYFFSCIILILYVFHLKFSFIISYCSLRNQKFFFLTMLYLPEISKMYNVLISNFSLFTVLFLSDPILQHFLYQILI